jgi:CheY-like chemotaxis protein
MTLTALLVCIDEAAAKVLHRVLEELSIRVESCPDFARAAIRLAQERFDVVIVDGESNAEVIALLRETRLSRLNDATLAVWVVAGQDNVREMFSLGVNFVLYKPVAYERALSSLRAARAVMRKEKRKNARATVHTQATIDYANVQQERATLVDLAQEGMQVRFGKKLPPTSKVYFQFKLPQQTSSVRLSGQVVWQDWNGRAGVQFVDVPKASRKLITDFLATNLSAESQQERLPDVTVEFDEPLQLATISVAEQTHGTPSSHGTRPQESARQDSTKHQATETEYEGMKYEGMKYEGTKYEAAKAEAATHASAYQAASDESVARSQPDADNRRTQTRYACRLGAEVYRTGVAVPHYCCLTDLSSGGCYLEVNLPFAVGSSVEIVVRARELKLRLRGAVQTSHPGYGMGIAFEVKAKEDQASVKQLTDFVAATTDPS